jgi:hypothetical protein
VAYDYGYTFNFPRGYDPGNSAEADQYYFDRDEFNRYVQVIETCVFHIKGPLSGTPLIIWNTIDSGGLAEGYYCGFVWIEA